VNSPVVTSSSTSTLAVGYTNSTTTTYPAVKSPVVTSSSTSTLAVEYTSCTKTTYPAVNAPVVTSSSTSRLAVAYTSSGQLLRLLLVHRLLQILFMLARRLQKELLADLSINTAVITSWSSITTAKLSSM
jgi:hypothetical protein